MDQALFERLFPLRRMKMSDSYHSGNMDKHNTKNPLKQLCLKRFMSHLLKEIKNHQRYNSIMNANLLDIGCGEGFVSLQILQHFPTFRIVGVDNSLKAIEKAKELCASVQKDNSANIIFQRGDIYNLGFQDNSFDIVLCLEVLEHLERPHDALIEIYRVCRRQMIISVPHEPWFQLGNILSFKHVKMFGSPIDHIQHWTNTSFSELCLAHFKTCSFSKSFPWLLAHITKVENLP